MASLFTQGILLGSGPCLLTCVPIVLPYIAATQKGWKEGLIAVLVFSSSKVLMYSLLGGLFGYIGSYLIQISPAVSRYLWIAGALLLIAIGLGLLFGKRHQNPMCKAMHVHASSRSLMNLFILGIVVGLSPCLPLTTALIQIALTSGGLFDGFLYGLAFGIGTAVSPLLIIGAVSGAVTSRIADNDRYFTTLNRLSGAILIAVGTFILFRL